MHTVVCTHPETLPALPEGVRRVQVPADVMKSISPTEMPQGVLAVCGLLSRPLPEKLEGRRYVVLDGVQDPGNVGTILRTADAFHTDGLFLVNGCADLYNPKTVRATMGAVFRCPVWSCKPEEVLELLERSGNFQKGSITGVYTVLVEGDDTNEPIADTVRGSDWGADQEVVRMVSEINAEIAARVEDIDRMERHVGRTLEHLQDYRRS